MVRWLAALPLAPLAVAEPSAVKRPPAPQKTYAGGSIGKIEISDKEA